MVPDSIDRIVLNIRWNRLTAIVSITAACLGALLWSNKQVTNIMNAIRDNTKENEVIRKDVTDLQGKVEKQGERLEVLWYKQTERK